MKVIHSPGSREAVKLGCTCPVMDNCNGKGYMGIDGIFIYNEDCKYHCCNKKDEHDQE
jgi:hypothetical protein